MEITVDNLEAGYRDKAILRNVSFTAKAGELTAIIGANGAGKSTLIRVLAGVMPAKGTVSFDGKSRKQFSAKALSRCIGYLTQETSSDVVLTVLEVVLLGRMISMPFKVPDEAIDQVWDALKEARVDHLATRLFSQLSGGQRKMVAIAQTIVRQPEVFLLDEPTANLDMHNQFEVLELIKKYTLRNRTATIVTLHDLNIAARYADRMILIADGGIYKNGRPQEVLTTESLRHAYQIDAEVTCDGEGIPRIHPLRSIHGP